MLVLVYCRESTVIPPEASTPLQSRLQSLLQTEEWPYLDQEVLRATRSRKVCLTCHWFRHHAGPNCIPLLTCQLHQGLIAQGEHLTHRCQGWTDDMGRLRGWAPEVA
ncbi:MAG: galactose oxidase [Cyanobacteriota bacterium]|nr:galactose oxidase [Cyanobacteriota bacterium]